MSRSVEKYGDFNVFFPLNEEEYEELEFQWDYLVEDIQSDIMSRYPSYEIVEDHNWAPYPYRETMILLENQHSQVCISEYCGLVCLGLKIRDDNDHSGLSSFWTTLAFDKMMKPWMQLRHVGTFSNGEAVFEHIK